MLALVPHDYVQVGEKTFGELAQAELVSYGDQWKDVALTDGKDYDYSPEKAKAAFAKAKRKNCKPKGVTSQSIWMSRLNRADVIAVQQANSLKRSIRSSLGTENVIDVINDDNEEWALRLK